MTFFILAFVIACIISFRSLWVSRKQSTKNREKDNIARFNRAQEDRALADSPTPKDNSWWQRLQKSLLDTMATLEGTTLDRQDSAFLRPRIPSAQMGIDFSKWSAEGSTTDSRTSASSSGSGTVTSV